ncbi:MAG: beta-lactamase class [Chthoniobacter sp.]|jgi:beta-lactamase class A|nr:beta-lactamase class [Chthoniobacter sp.]
MNEAELRERIVAIAHDAKFDAVAVSVYDYERKREFDHDSARSFHAASTIKVAILLAIYKLAEDGRIHLDDTLHVRNRFRSLIESEVFRVAASRDADGEVHQRLGRSMRIRDLARAMITRSSNLATNVLLDYLGIERVQAILNEAKIDGVRLVRGVEDNAAFEKQMNNEVTATGLVQLFRLCCERGYLRAETRGEIIEVLSAQEFNNMIPAGVPASAKVAHKTGEISTVCHDAGIVFLSARAPWIVAILTEMPATIETRHKTVAAVARAICEFVVNE